MTKVIEPSEIYKCLDLEDLSGETWNYIYGMSNFYMASNLGRIKSVSRLIIRKDGKPQQIKEKILKPRFLKKGYLYVMLSLGFRKKTATVSRLIAQTFIPNPENKPQVNHKKGLKWDNRASELEWSTPSENCRHAVDFRLTSQIGETHSKTKITVADVIEIRQMRLNGDSYKKIGSKFNINKGSLFPILNGKSWGHVAKHLDEIEKIRIPKRKLNQETVDKIRQLSSAGVTGRKLAQDFGVCFQNISLIINGKTWCK